MDLEAVVGRVRGRDSVKEAATGMNRHERTKCLIMSFNIKAAWENDAAYI